MSQTSKTIADQRTQLQSLQDTVESQKKDIASGAAKLRTVQADLEDANAKVEQNRKCPDAVQKVVDALNANDDAAGQSAMLNMIVACGAHV
jgi:septal ring factor EnvC (AmiA/AmiB activator)